MTRRPILQTGPNVRTACVLAAAVVLALSACSRNDEDEQGSATSQSAQPPTADTPPAADVPTTAAPSAAAQPGGTIPQSLRGRWGLVAADCTSTHGDAKGLMEVGATTLTFYESRATLKTVRAAEPTRLRAAYAFTGEGQEWTLDVDLRTWNDGAQLIRQDRGADALPGPLTYTRCAG